MLCRNAADLTLPQTNIRVIVLDEIQHPLRVVAGLLEMWPRLRDLPPIPIIVDILMAAFTLVGKLAHVDELSFIKEPNEVLMKFISTVPEKLKVSVVVYVNGQGFRVDVVSKFPRRGTSSLPSLPPKPNDKDDPEEDDGNLTEDQMALDTHTGKGRMEKLFALLPRAQPGKNLQISSIQEKRNRVG
jgi:hypothetical protein